MIKNIRLWMQKYKRREFLPGYIFDIPVYMYVLYLIVKSGHIGFFTNVNPGMILSGFAGYSKYDDVGKFEARIFPTSILVPEGQPYLDTEQAMKTSNIMYPCIAKPTLGRTGRDVKKIHNIQELKLYLKNIHEDILIQEFIDYPLEFGIFYYRIPGERKGHITGIVEKKFMFLQGDGKSTFEQLVYHHPRAKYYYHQLKKEYADKRANILIKGEQFQLNYIGNHCRGSLFNDLSHLINEQLETVIDEISQKIDGFYFGRYDIKVKNTEDLYQGNFKILELNGMGSLPTHMYDPKYGIINAYKTLFQHRDIVYTISQENKKRGHAFVPWKKMHRIIKKYGI